MRSVFSNPIESSRGTVASIIATDNAADANPKLRTVFLMDSRHPSVNPGSRIAKLGPALPAVVVLSGDSAAHVAESCLRETPRRQATRRRALVICTAWERRFP